MKKLFNRKNSVFIGVTLVVLISFIFLGNTVNADAGDWAINLVGGIARIIVSILGWILTKLMGILIYVAQYNNFTHAEVIIEGWKVARDVANMFFIVILLIIAFATILRVEKYNYKKWLPKLILMAILINFSKTIAGLFIDVSQVIMLTFVNAFSTIGAGSLTDMLGIADWQSFEGTEQINRWEVAAAYVLAVIYAFIALATIAAMVAMLVMRIIMSWIYVVLSPFAYLLAAFPDGASYASRWWSEFSKNLIIGPVLAFFIWLSFAALGSPTSDNSYQALGQFTETGNNSDINIEAQCPARDENGDCVEYGTSNLMIQFIVSIAMLLGGMKIAQEIGGAGGSAAGKTFGKVKGLGMMGAGAAGGLLGRTAKKASGYTFAKRRYTNWRQDLKKSSEQNADLRYEKTKGRVKGVASGVTAGISRQLSSKTEADREKIRLDKDIKYKKKQEEKRVKEARYEAYQTGVYTDSGGKKFKYDEATKTYKDESGNVAEDSGGNVIKKMSDFSRAYNEQVRDKTTKARALKNQMNDEKMSQKQKLFESAGTSEIDLKRVMQDGSQSRDKRTAAAIELAIKDGFKNDDLKKGRQEVSEAKQVLGNNKPLLDKFDEKINKRFAALNFDVSTDKGKGEYKAAIADGRVDGYKQDASTYDKEHVKVLRDYSGKDFGKKYGDMMSLSKDHRQKGMQSLRSVKVEALQKGESLYNNTTGEMNPFVKLLAKNGEMEAFSNSTDAKTFTFDAKSQEAMGKFLETASASDLDNFNTDYLQKDKFKKQLESKGMNMPAPGDTQSIIERMEKTITASIDVPKVASLEHLDKNPEFVRRYVGLVNKHGPSSKKDLINDNNVLKNIKPIT